MGRLLIIGGLFVLAGLCEIGGGYLVWGWVRENRPVSWALVGAGVLALYGVVAALQPITEFGRVYAAYGGVFIALALLWGVLVDGFRPDRYDLLGALICVVGALLRVTVLSDPDAFEVFVGLVLLYLGARLLYEVFAGLRRGEPRRGEDADGEAAVRITESSPLRVRYEYGGKTYAFGTPAVLALSVLVGIVGGIYSIGGGSIIAPFLVTVFGLPVYTVAGATLVGTFVTSVAGVAFYELLAVTGLGSSAGAAIAPDWWLGLTLGAGGLAGTYAGAALQGRVPERWIRAVLGALVTLLALRYVL